jgi:hypothetical protein
MTAAAAADLDDVRLDPREARAERRRAMLEQLAEIGMALARDLSRRVGEGLERGEPLDGGDAALEFSRISRSVRQTLALEARLDQDRDALAKMFAAEREARETARRQRIEDRRECVRGAVDEAIEKAGGPQRQRTRLCEALDERLEDPPRGRRLRQPAGERAGQPHLRRPGHDGGLGPVEEQRLGRRRMARRRAGLALRANGGGSEAWGGGSETWGGGWSEVG